MGASVFLLIFIDMIGLQIECRELDLGKLFVELRELQLEVGEQGVLGLEELLEGGTVSFSGWFVWEPEFRVHGVRDLVPEINSSDFCLLDLGLHLRHPARKPRGVAVR